MLEESIKVERKKVESLVFDIDEVIWRFNNCMFSLFMPSCPLTIGL